MIKIDTDEFIGKYLQHCQLEKGLSLKVTVKSAPALSQLVSYETIPPCSVVQCMAVPCTAG